MRTLTYNLSVDPELEKFFAAQTAAIKRKLDSAGDGKRRPVDGRKKPSLDDLDRVTRILVRRTGRLWKPND